MPGPHCETDLTAAVHPARRPDPETRNARANFSDAQRAKKRADVRDTPHPTWPGFTPDKLLSQGGGVYRACVALFGSGDLGEGARAMPI
jgi:hypothetical protein